MLIDQNGEDPTFFHQIDRIQVAFAPVEGPQAQPLPAAFDQAVDILVALGLENGPDRKFANAADELRVKFPIADVVDGHDHAAARFEGGAESGKSDQIDPGLHFFLRQAGEARHAEQVRAQRAEVLPHGAPDFAVAHLTAESDGHVALGQPAVTGEHGPRHQTEKAAEPEGQREWEPAEHSEQRKGQQVNRVIHG